MYSKWSLWETSAGHDVEIKVLWGVQTQQTYLQHNSYKLGLKEHTKEDSRKMIRTQGPGNLL